MSLFVWISIGLIIFAVCGFILFSYLSKRLREIAKEMGDLAERMGKSREVK